MDTETSYTIVGAFVITGIIAIIIGILWLSSGLAMGEFKNYIIYMTESVSGLGVDAPVEFNGVSVGSVKSIELSPNNANTVILVINIKGSTPVSAGTTATLTTRGLTGLGFVSLKDDGKNHTLLKVQGKDPYPVIPTSPSIFLRLDTALSKVSRNFQTMTESLQKLLDDQNLKSLSATFAHLDAITGTLASNTTQMQKILQQTATASAQLTPLLTSTNNAMHALETQAFPQTYRLLNNLEIISRNLSEASVAIKTNPAVLIRGTSAPKPGPGE